jgi:L-ascorbate metabolism protein UlaG (beta-lactamase superfamily)
MTERSAGADRPFGLRRDAAVPASDHFDGRRFFNPGVSTDKGFRDLWRWWRAGGRTLWPRRVEDGRQSPPPHAIDEGRVAATFVGQATFLLQLPGLNLLTDPVFSERVSPVGWAGPRRARDPGIAWSDLPPVGAVLLSHNHYDHMDLPTLRRLKDLCDPVVVTGLGNARTLRRTGLRAVELDWWQDFELPGGARATYVPAQHWSGRRLVDRRRALWGGFVIEAPDAPSVYFAGDTGYAQHSFRAVRERLGAPDLALLPIGAYEPRWFMAAQHMDPDDAVRAHLDLGAGLSLAMHFGTFQLTDEGIDVPLQALAAALERHGVPQDAFRVPEFGATILHGNGAASG